ncbi:MAG: hypothetical protein DMF06_01800 [Verrucomicrobia bacterium]|nr:MAG: hypothetical protein DMF06_01800 [Verrucomicrobiota bacterium]
MENVQLALIRPILGPRHQSRGDLIIREEVLLEDARNAFHPRDHLVLLSSLHGLAFWGQNPALKRWAIVSKLFK